MSEVALALYSYFYLSMGPTVGSINPKGFSLTVATGKIVVKVEPDEVF